MFFNGIQKNYLTAALLILAGGVTAVIIALPPASLLAGGDGGGGGGGAGDPSAGIDACSNAANEGGGVGAIGNNPGRAGCTNVLVWLDQNPTWQVSCPPPSNPTNPTNPSNSSNPPNSSDPVPPPQCSNGEDDDGDGRADFGGANGLPPDPACASPTVGSEENPSASVSLRAEPNLVRRGDDATLVWVATAVTDCEVTVPGGAVLDDFTAVHPDYVWSDSSTVTDIQNEQTYVLSCTDFAGELKTDPATIRVLPVFEER